MQIIYLIGYGFSLDLLLWMILPILAVVGGILLLVRKRAGGVIALIVGAIWLTIAILLNLGLGMVWMDFLMIIPPFSFFLWYLDFTIWDYLFVEIVLVFVGGILGVAGGSD